MDIQSLRPGMAITSHGTLHFISRGDPGKSGKPLVFMLHGALRRAEHLADWFPILTDDYELLICDLPGHGRDDGSEAADMNVYMRRVYEATTYFARPFVVVGESLGGLVALGIAHGQDENIRGIIAADPPLSTAKQWCVSLNLMKESLTPYQKDLFAMVLGLRDDQFLGERLYYDLIKKAARPAIVVSGTKYLFPVRTSLPKEHDVPCLIDSVDRAFIDTIGNKFVSVQQVEGAGHLCLSPKFPRAVDLVTGFCRERLG